jgi:hypothetical protein
MITGLDSLCGVALTATKFMDAPAIRKPICSDIRPLHRPLLPTAPRLTVLCSFLRNFRPTGLTGPTRLT